MYITNATLSSLSGWTNVNFNNPVQGNNTTGYAVECYEGWSSVEKSEYSLTQTITLPAGNYTLVNYSFFREGQNYNTDANTSRAYLKAGSNQVLVKTLGSIQTAAGYANDQAEGANCFDSKMYRNTLDFTIDTDNTSIEIGVFGTFNTEITKSWMILGMFELIANDIPATMDAPFDVTGYITNPGFEYRNMTGWTTVGDFGTQNNSQSFKVGSYYAEAWQASGALTARSFSQTLTDLPAGYYKLTANLGGNGTYIDLNGKKASWTEDKDYTVGYVLAENEDLTITAGKTAEGTANWIHFDNFRLQFCGDVAAALTTLCDQVSSYEGTIPTAAYNQLVSDVAAKNQTYSDVDELLAAIDDVQDLYDAADLLKPNYTAWLEMKGLADALVAVDNNNSEANSTFASAITAQNTAANNSTTAADIATATANLKAAMVTYVGAADPTSGNRFDLTFMIAVPDMTDLWTGTWYVTPEGWATEQEGGNFQVMQNNDADAEDGIHKVFTEYYYLNNNTTWGNNKFNVYTTIDNLPVGTYTMSCYAFAKEQNYSSGAANPQVFFYANNTQGSLVNNSRLQEKSISFINDEQQNVKVGLKPLAGNTLNWMGIGYVKLYKEYTDNTTYEIDVTETYCTVATTVDEEVTTSAKALKTVTLTVTPEEGYTYGTVTATYNDGEVQNLTVANPSSGVYTYQQPAYNVTVTATCVVDKSALNTAIATATAARVIASEGTGVFLKPTSAGETFAAAIATAQGVYDNASATVSEVATAVTTLENAQATYQSAINAPTPGQAYIVANTTASGVLKVATESITVGANAAVFFTAVEGGYVISNANDEYIFKTTGNNWTLSTTTNENEAYVITSVNPVDGGFTIQGAKGLFGTDATESGSAVYANKAQANNGVWTISEATVVNMTVAAGKFGTFIAPFDVTIPEGVTASKVTGIVGNTLVLQEVETTIPANTPVVVTSASAVNETFYGISTATQGSYTDGLLTGVYTTAVVPVNSYVLKTQNGYQAFYKVTESGKKSAANRCYLTLPAESTVKAFYLNFSDETAINAVEATQNENAAIFNLAGQRVSKAQKGLYIVNGKKVIMR